MLKLGGFAFSRACCFTPSWSRIQEEIPVALAADAIISAVAQLERDIIAERVKAGLRRAKENGKHIGRPVARVDHDEALSLRKQGFSLRGIGQQLGVSHVTIRRILNGSC